MDAKLLILCDEKPGTNNDGHKEYKIRDSIFLADSIRYPEDDTDKIFVSWDSIIPEDRTFIEECKYYATFREKPNPTFVLSKRGSIDPARGTIKTSLQEESYYKAYEDNLNYLQKLARERGKDLEWQAEVIDLSVQYPLQANQRFFDDFSKMLEYNNIIRILPTFSRESENNITEYRKAILDAWNNMNKITKKVSAKVLPVEMYSDFGEIFYKKSTDEMLKIYSMPIFGENPDGHDDGPEL